MNTRAYSADLIADYATLRAYSRSPSGKIYEHAYYDPPHNGIHLCGADMNDAAATTACYPMPKEQARRAFELAKAEAECDREVGDFVVDLFIDGDVEGDFHTNRQLWPRAIKAWNRSLVA